MSSIHPTAIIDPGACLGDDVTIGPYAIIGAGVTLGDRTRVMAYVLIDDGCQVGADCEIFTGAVLGHTAQTRATSEGRGVVRIGAGSVIREQVTIHAAKAASGATVIGAQAYLMAHCHVAHDCQIGDEVTIANGALIAGHAMVESQAFISGNVVVHQYVRVGMLSMVAGQARVAKDVPPYLLVAGDSRVHGVNVVGLRRHGMSADRRRAISDAHRVLYRSGLNVSQATRRLRQLEPTPEIQNVLQFIERSTRGLCGGRRARPARRWPPGGTP